MSSNGGRDEEFRQVNHVKDEYQGDVSVVVGNGPGSVRYDELEISKVDENVKRGGDCTVVQGNAVSQAPQLQPQGSLVRWERFLHVRSIKVMLVENDDSTRHIVTALLRNCNYEVIEVANGLQAWKILEDLSNHIDIVLTEVVMPSLSGIGLLCKIMSHKTRKNIPVIMMSSHDSMGLVFKCLSKGAVDFLLKPIRKNELKNLWQHVWRRCHSSSGSGSESGTHAQKSVNSKRSDDSISIIGDDIGSTGDGSDDGSGTQSSWTKQAVELESPQAASPCNQIAEHPDSTCGLVIHSAETPATRDFHDQEGQPDDVGKGQELAIGGSKDSEIQTEFPVKDPNIHNGIEQTTPNDFDSTQNTRGDAIGMRGPQPVNREFEALKEPAKILERNTRTTDDSNGVTITKLSLKRPSGLKEVQNGHNILRHSELSAFTRYNTSSNAIKTGTSASSSQLDNRTEIMKKESTRDAHSDGYLIYGGSNEVCSNIDVDYSTNEYYMDGSIQKERSEARSLINCLHPSFNFKHIQTDPRYISQQAVPRRSDDIPLADLMDPPRVHHIHHHHHVHHYHNIEPKQPPFKHEDSSLKELAASAPHCGSSNVLGEAVEGNFENYSLNRSASGSKHGSNGQNGSSAAVDLEGKHAESGGGLAGKSGSGGVSGSGSENKIDQHKSAHREAALMKFRQKRKDRCFQKKVRYQNRKRLADQRPRVRGQFVKQIGQESSSNAADG